MQATTTAASEDPVQQLLRTLGVPSNWDPSIAPEGVLFAVLPEPHNLSRPLPSSGCSFYSVQDCKRRAYRSLPVLVEATLSTLVLRRHMTPQLPIALAAPRSTAAFVSSRPELTGVWDRVVALDEDALLLALRLPLTAASRPFLWKLVALLRTPFERTLFLDADVLALSRTFARDVLRNSLRIHEIAMPVDTGRPGNLRDHRTRVRVRCKDQTSWLCGYWNRRATATPSQQRAFQQKAQEETAAAIAPTDEEAGALEPPMFGQGLPPVCSCVTAFRRTPRVRRLLAHAATRLAHRLNPNDLTDPAVSVRQSDQEMLWLELFTGPPEQQPALLVLPEEYYCPAAAGTNQAIDIAARLRRGLRPAWGYTDPRTMRNQAFMPKEHLHYLAGGQKDCHATHVHYALSRLRGQENMTGDASQGGTMHYALHLLDLEHYCWRRQAAGERGCTVSRETKQLYPDGALPAGASDDPAMVRRWVGALQQKRGSGAKRMSQHCGSSDEAPTVAATLQLVQEQEIGRRGVRTGYRLA